MKKISIILSLLTLTLSGCYNTLSLDGFDKEQWKKARTTCSEYRLQAAELILNNEEVILNATQNEVESLLGKAEEHELYERNQKFFHYRLSPPDTCSNANTITYLSIRFNAIGRANLVQLMLRDANK